MDSETPISLLVLVPHTSYTHSHTPPATVSWYLICARSYLPFLLRSIMHVEIRLASLFPGFVAEIRDITMSPPAEEPQDQKSLLIAYSKDPVFRAASASCTATPPCRGTRRPATYAAALEDAVAARDIPMLPNEHTNHQASLVVKSYTRLTFSSSFFQHEICMNGDKKFKK